jgi:SPP1 family predicted phage head-tail adaptor
MNTVIDLITTTITEDELKQQIETPSYHQVFAEQKPIHSNEFFNAGQKGIKPTAMFEVHSMEYNGEEQLRYNGKVYHIYRTYPKPDKTELYCEVRLGV